MNQMEKNERTKACRVQTDLFIALEVRHPREEQLLELEVSNILWPPDTSNLIEYIVPHIGY